MSSTQEIYANLEKSGICQAVANMANARLATLDCTPCGQYGICQLSPSTLWPGWHANVHLPAWPQLTFANEGQSGCQLGQIGS